MNNEGIPNSYNCPQCQSSFLEEVERSSSIVNASILNSTVLTSTILSSNILRARNAVLNNEQSRRLANAAIMLRLLEIQLRDELDTLQNGIAQSVLCFISTTNPSTDTFTPSYYSTLPLNYLFLEFSSLPPCFLPLSTATSIQ